MTRSLPEWVGKTDDTRAPLRVRLRCFERANGTCHITGRKITPADKWELDHIVALINGGENRESNLAPALVKAHRQKTAEDVAMKAKDARVRAKHIGAERPKKKIPYRRFDGTPVWK